MDKCIRVTRDTHKELKKIIFDEDLRSMNVLINKLILSYRYGK